MLLVLPPLSWAPTARHASQRGAGAVRARPATLVATADQLQSSSDLHGPVGPPEWTNELRKQLPVDAVLQHGEFLPESVMHEWQDENMMLALHFVKTFLSLAPHTQRAKLFVTGGFVRDLLRGTSELTDDLDLSICLRGCPGDVSITKLMGGLGAFAQERQDLGVEDVKVATTLSTASKEKGIDCAKVTFAMVGGRHVHLDFMPTIGAESYEAADRVPRRNQRGTAREDSLRRDLAVSSMLLLVTLPDGQATDSGVCTLRAAQANARALRYRLLDYHGGLKDLRERILRSPTPAQTPLEDVWSEVIGTAAEKELAIRVGIGARIGPGLHACGETVARPHHPNSVCDANGACDLGDESASALSPAEMEAAMMQAVWWIKVLRDDPLRILRTLRFAYASPDPNSPQNHVGSACPGTWLSDQV